MHPSLSFNAARLKTLFAVYGHYYDLMIAGERYPCRVTLELIRHEAVGELAERRPDLLVVMMNPGSSRPLPPGFVAPLARSLSEIPRTRHLVPAKPDTTQYQIMRLMAAKGFVHARVLNLSDLRQAKSPLLVAEVARLSSLDGGGAHSLFDAARRAEFLALAGEAGRVPVVAGWGRHGGLKNLARQALSALRGWTVVGVPVAGEPLLYGHPSPQLQRLKEVWLQEVMGQM